MSTPQRNSLNRVINDVLQKPAGTYVARHASKINPLGNSFIYEGPFAITTSGKLTIDIAFGLMILGSGEVQIERSVELEVESEASEDALVYVYVEMYSKIVFGGETVLYEVKFSNDRPVREKKEQDGAERYIYPVILGTVEVRDYIPGVGNVPAVGTIGNVVQYQFGDHYVAGVLS